MTETLAALTEDDWPAPDPYGTRLVEDEYGDTFFAPGHVDKETFARSVDHYDTEVCGLVMDVDAEPAEAENVRHRWAVTVVDPSDGCGWAIYWGDITEQTPGSFPVTVMHR